MLDFQLPSQATVDRFIAKNKFFDNAIVNSKIKDEFTNTIQKITWRYKLAESTINTKKTDNVEEIQVFEISLKKKELPKNALKVIDKSIPYPILYIFIFENSFSYGIMHKTDPSGRYYISSWDERKDFTFNGINLEEIYQKIVKQFIDEPLKKEMSFDEVIQNNTERDRLNNEVQSLRIKINKEKQFNKKVELNTQLHQKQSQLDAL